MKPEGKKRRIKYTAEDTEDTELRKRINSKIGSKPEILSLNENEIHFHYPIKKSRAE